MAGLMTGIQLQDNFTNVLLGIVNSVNLAVSSMEDMSQVMNADIDTSSIEGAREYLAQATIAAQELQRELEHVGNTPVKAPSAPETLDTPEWVNQSNIQYFDSAGMQRLSDEMGSMAYLLDDVFQSQQRINEQALNMDILPPNASQDINATGQRIDKLSRQLESLQGQDASLIGNDNAEWMAGQYERIRSEMNDIVNLQAQLDQAIEAGDLSGLNEGYNRLNDMIGQVEQQARTASQAMDTLTDIQWQSDTMPVFDSAGMERFQQEVQRTDQMLDALNQTQQQITHQAAGMDFLPSGGFTDLANMQSRLQAVQQRIQAIENNPLNMGTDVANTELEQLRSQLDMALSEQQNLNRAMENMDVSAANESYLRLSQTIGNTERYIRDNVDEQGRFNQQIRDGTYQADNLASKIKTMAAAYLSIHGLASLLDRVGVMDAGGAFDRIDTMNQFQKTVSIMTGDAEMANAALAKLKDTTVGTAYGLDVASKATQGFLTRGMGLGAATEQVRIWADAVSFYGDGTNEQLENVVDAIGKMYSKGKVEADQLDRLFDAGIGAAEIYADAVGESVSVVKDDLSSGAISAAQFIETISQAMDEGVSSGAAKDAGGTWASTFANVQSAITRGWVSIIENLDAELAAHGLPSTLEMVAMFGQNIESVMNSVGNNLNWIVGLGINVGNVLGSAGNFIIDNWSIVSPILYGVIAALIAYGAYLGTLKAIELASAAIKITLCLATYAHAAATGTAVTATAAATAAQYGFNTALLACPVTWIIILIIGLIAVLYAAVAAINKLNNTSLSATGLIGAYFGTMVTCIANYFIMLWNTIADFINFFANVFDHPIASVALLFLNLADNVIGYITEMARAIETVINRIPGIHVNITDGLDGFRSRIEGMANDIKDKSGWTEVAQKREYLNGADMANKGYEMGKNLESKVMGMFSSRATDNSSNASDYASLLAGSNDLSSAAANTGDTAKNTAKIADSVAITSEDLKYIRDLAEHDYINRFTTASITVNQTNHNTVNSNMDVDGITEHLRTTIEEQMYASAEGVH